MKVEFKYITELTKSYGLMHYTGNGVAEDDYRDQGFIAQGDDYRELDLLGIKLYHSLNSDAAIISTWTGDKFKVITKK